METKNIPLTMDGVIMKCLAIRPSYIVEMMELFPDATDQADLRYDIEAVLIMKSQAGEVHWEETGAGILWHKTVFAGAGSFTYDPAKYGEGSSVGDATLKSLMEPTKGQTRLADWRAKRQIAKAAASAPVATHTAEEFFEENPFKSSLSHDEWLASLDSAESDFAAKRSAKKKKGA